MTVLRNVLAVILGWGIGSAINLGLVNTGHSIFPVEGLDPNNMASIAEIIPTLSPKYFLFPFLAHALGTIIGAFAAGVIAASHKMKFSIAIGVLFLLGGIAVNYLIPGPMWFTTLDILIAYIPMALVGGKLALRYSSKND